MKEKRYTSGEIASASGLTIRAIQHYDNIGLLRSAGRTEGGRRYYTEDDLIRLEQIVLYKSLDFSLEQIKEQILLQPSQDGLLGIFKEQQLLILQKMEHLHTTFSALGIMSKMIQNGKEVPLTLLLQILSALPRDDFFSQAPQMLTEKQREMLSLRFRDLGSIQQFYHKWKEFMIEAMVLTHEGSSPESQEAQGLISRWWEDVISFTQGDQQLIRQLSELNLEDQMMTGSPEILESAKKFIEDAFKIYTTREKSISDDE